MSQGKTEKMELAAEHVLRILLERGPEALTYARVAAASRVSRPWLYKYVGRTRAELMEFAVIHFGKFYAELENQVVIADRAGFIEHSIAAVRRRIEMSRRFPWILPIYYRYLTSETPMGETIRRLEGLYLQKVTAEIERFLKPKRQPARSIAEAFTAMNLGIVFRSTLPGASGKHARDAVEVVRILLESVE